MEMLRLQVSNSLPSTPTVRIYIHLTQKSFVKDFLFPDNGSDMLAVLHYSGAPNAEPPSPAPLLLPSNAVRFTEFQVKVG